MHPQRNVHIIYLSGFGDKYDTLRRVFLYCWRIFGVDTTLVPMAWETPESYQDKLRRAIDVIDTSTAKRIVLIGESAAGTMILPLYHKRRHRLYKVMSLCGKNHDAGAVDPKYFQKHVAFKEAANSADAALQLSDASMRHNFVSFYPLYDEVIPLRESVIPDCRTIRIPSVGHLATIFLSLTVFSGIIVRIAKQ